MSDINETVAPLATEAGQDAIVLAINNISSFSYAVRAENAATTATQKASDASGSAADALAYRNAARNWATKMDTYVDTETITIPAEQEGEEDTTETVYLFSARYYAALAQDFYNNMTFDNAPTQNSTNLLTSGTIYTALADKADSATTLSGYGITDAYTKTEVDTLISTAVSNLVNSAPSTLDTLEELANALGDDPNFATTIATQLGNKADSSSVPTKVSDLTNDSGFITGVAWNDVSSKPTFATVATSGSYSDLSNKPTVDSAPMQNSTNLVESGGVYTAIANATPNITTDSEPTEDSENLITSGAVWEALQNFTPSGGGILSGTLNSGIVKELLYENDNGWNSGTEIDLQKNINDYDFIIFDIRRSSTEGNIKTYPSEYLIQNYLNGGTLRFLIDGYDNDYLDVRFDNSHIYADGNYRNLKIYKITGIKFPKILSELSYSNVLYENLSSGLSSGTLTLLDEWDNYDFIVFLYSHPQQTTTGTGGNKFVPDNKIFYKKELNDLYTNEGHVLLTGYDNRFMSLTIGSDKKTFGISERSDANILGVYGYKLSSGQYTGIVSDARMTVKSGTITTGNNLSANNGYEYSATFNSSMPDTNYVVQLTGSNLSAYWADIKYTVKDKTVNGFTVVVWVTHAVDESHTIDWIAIRPNSYTREGMVEDVLFSNASGVNSGTINLSGNISDYDLIEIRGNNAGNANYGRPSWIISSSRLLEAMQNSWYPIYDGADNIYIKFFVTNENTITLNSQNGNCRIEKIIGIKFGRYVSGVQVDDTISSSATGVPSTSAVYTALLNAGGGGGGGSSITLDSTPTENSTNGVTSGGVYEALHPSIESRIPNDMKVNTANLVLFADGGRTLYKKYDGVAAAVVANSHRNLHAVLVSNNADAVRGYSSYNTNSVTTASTLTYAGELFYYSGLPYGYDKSNYSVSSSNIRIILSLFDNDELVVRYILDILYPELASKELEDYNITDAYTKEEIYNILYKTNKELDFPFLPIPEDMRVINAGTRLFSCGGRDYYKRNNGRAAGALCKCGNNNNLVAILFAETSSAAILYSSYSSGTDSTVYNRTRNGKTYYFTFSPYGIDNPSSFSNSVIRDLTSTTFTDAGVAADYILDNILLASNYSLSDYNITNAYTKTEVDTLLQNAGGSSITVDSTITLNGTNPVEGGAIYTALASKGDVTTDTDQNITGTKTFVGSKKVGFKQSTANDKLGFTLYGNTGTERGYLEFNPTNTVDGITGLMTLGNYATSAAGLTQVGFRRYSNISGASGAYNLLMPMVADAKTPFSLTTTYQNFYLPLGFTDGTTTVKTAKSGLVDISPLLASLELRIAALEGN